MTTRPLVSVIVPTFNRAHLIREAVDSVLAQTYDHLELIVIDDGSTDDTLAVLRGYADPRLRLIHQENRGKSGARNRGLDEARGDYIAFLDSDDIWDVAFLRTLLEVLVSEPGVDFAFCDFQRFDALGTRYARQSEFLPELTELKTRPSAGGAGKVFLRSPFLAFVPMLGFATWLQTVLLRSSTLGRSRFEFGVPLGQDFRYMLSVWAASRAAAYVDRALVLARRHDGNSYPEPEAGVLAPHAIPTLESLLGLEQGQLNEAERKALAVRTGLQLRGIGSFYFWNGQPLRAAPYFWRAFGFPANRGKALLYLLALPYSLFARKKEQ